MSQTAVAVLRLRCFTTVTVHPSRNSKPRLNPKFEVEQNRRQARGLSISNSTTATVGFGKKKKGPEWQCVQNCGACCKLDKGPDFPSPEDIFDDPSDVQNFKSLVGPDGWCKHFEKATRKCAIYADRPYFCRVEPDVFLTLYGIEKKKFNREACSCCIDTIKAVYGSKSKELDNFNHAIWNTNTKLSVE